jgi:transforming growth factor-beta-induced protein
MKNIKQKLTQKFPFLFLVMVLSSTLLFVSCNDDDNDDMIIEIIQPTETIVGIAASNPDFSTLVSILSMPEFSDLFAAANNPDAELTVFAPNNTAFSNLLTALGKSSLSELPIDLVREIIEYHILGQKVLSTQLTNGTVYTLLPYETISIDLASGVKINTANVIAADLEATNGVIHVVDTVLLPSFVTNALGSISEVFLFENEYSILSAALKKANLLNTVSTTQGLTLFAPSNDAFVAAGITSLDGLDAAALSPILLYHVLGAKVLSSELPADGVATTLSDNQNIYLGYLTNSVLINGLTQITEVDIEKSNGVVHKINRTLVPPAPNVIDIAVALSQAENPEFTVLVSLLTSPAYSGITQAIIDSDNITVFAPTDAAFAEISATIATLTEEQISDVLLYHAVGARVFSTDLSDGQVVGMLNSQEITVNIGTDGVSLTDTTAEAANVVEVNIQGSNGVIHVIDKVLIPSL